MTGPTIVGYQLADDGSFQRVAPEVSTMPAIGLGLGWLINTAKGVCGHPGADPGAVTSLTSRLGTGTTTVACTNRLVPIEPVNARLVRPIA